MASVAAGTRTATMLLAVVVVGAVVLDRLTRRRRAMAQRDLRAATITAAIGLGPAAVLFGWFYVRIQLLYGDIGASTFLLEHFDREPRGSIGHVLTQGRLWSHLYHRMVSTARCPWAWPRFANVCRRRRQSSGSSSPLVRPRTGTSRRAIALCLARLWQSSR